jgi:hypothetical protein
MDIKKCVWSTGIRMVNSENVQNDDIQRAFPIGPFQEFQAICSILSFSDGSRFCYMMSQLYTLDRPDDIDQNSFPTGIFPRVLISNGYTLLEENHNYIKIEFYRWLNFYN